MHIQIINFNLEGINRAEYEGVCNELKFYYCTWSGRSIIYFTGLLFLY